MIAMGTRRHCVRLKTSSGFTLIEVMVSMAVLGMIAVAIWAATSQTAKTREIVGTSQDKLHQVRVAFDMMTRDFASAFLSLNRAQLEPSHDTIFIARNHGEEDRVDFAAFTHQRRYLDSKESDQCEVAYFLADDPENSGQMNLVRRESPLLDTEPLEGGQYLVVIEDVAALDFQYFDFVMNEWKDEWDTTEVTGEGNLLPHQVRVRLVIHDRRGKELAYGTQFPVLMRSPILQKGYHPGEPLMVTK